MMATDTKQIMEEYLDSIEKDSYVYRRRRAFYRPEVFQFEEEIGKSVFEMNEDEFLTMFAKFRAPNGRRYIDKITSYDSVVAAWRMLFDWYSRNKQPIYNPFASARMRGKDAFMRINCEEDGKIDYEWLRKQLDDLYDIYPLERASYIDCLAMLFYDGVANIPELISINEDMIDFKNRTVTFPRKTIHLSPRTLQLMMYVHGITEIPGYRNNNFAMEPYHDSYLRFSVRPANVAKFQDTDRDTVATKVSAALINNIKDKSGSPVNYQAIYALGCYDALAKQFGREALDLYIYDAKASELDGDEIAEVCATRGVSFRMFGAFKRRLYQFASQPKDDA